METVAAGITIGITADLVIKALISIGIGVATGYLLHETTEKIKEWIKTREIDTNISDHVLTKKHKFNNKCHVECILQVARNVNIYNSWFSDAIPIIRGTGYCKHGCEIEIRMSIPFSQQKWKIGTAFHKGICKAMGSQSINNMNFKNNIKN